MNNTKRLWNKRSKLLGATLASVLEQSFPKEVNEVITAIHVREILLGFKPDTSTILDIGCGWGRLAGEIVRQRNAFVYGIDVAAHFVTLFNRRLKKRGRAIIGDMRKLPFRSNTFDVVYCIESLMYLSEPVDQKKAISEILRVLKKTGKFVLIEQNTFGDQFFRLGGVIPFIYRTILGKQRIETHGVTFGLAEMELLIHNSGGRITRRVGYPFFTILLLPSVTFGKLFPQAAKIILAAASFVDRYFPFIIPSYFVTWVIEKA